MVVLKIMPLSLDELLVIEWRVEIHVMASRACFGLTLTMLTFLFLP